MHPVRTANRPGFAPPVALFDADDAASHAGLEQNLEQALIDALELEAAGRVDAGDVVDAERTCLDAELLDDRPRTRMSNAARTRSVGGASNVTRRDGPREHTAGKTRSHGATRRHGEASGDFTGSAATEAFDARTMPVLIVGGAQPYALIEPLGRGGMAEVYAAREVATGRTVAVKVIRPERAQKPRARARFELEAAIMSRVSHPNVVNFQSLHTADDGTLFMVLERLPGRTLKSWMRGAQEIGPRTALSIFFQILRALGSIHRAGIVHRDVKPSNVMIVDGEDGEPTVKLIDFGLAEIDDASARNVPRTTGRTLGTPAYVAPEQAMGLPADPRSDLYSACAMLYELLGGQRLFRARTVNHLILKHLHDKPVSLREHAPWIAPEVAEVVMRGLRKRPERRFDSARDLARALACAMRPQRQRPAAPVAAAAADPTPT